MLLPVPAYAPATPCPLFERLTAAHDCLFDPKSREAQSVLERRFNAFDCGGGQAYDTGADLSELKGKANSEETLVQTLQVPRAPNPRP
eukprot:3941515-Rhodomonas_salina.2